ncbi:dioxygenase [Xanthomonas populi]|uniref:Dioxygenase n=1 Tax=Xanthomonas populi TaxID=53414 RepID=A0A2S7ELT8_9XANT|nr:hypothetical protein [Xanthomonas populi]PPU91216.1 hypothetical protein XpopCFBP1817_14715 [Xanthomonas populi]
MARLPSLYISHGSPMTALQPRQVGARLAELAQTLPRPRAIVAALAHWLGRRPLVSGAARPATLHDFGGFPAPVYVAMGAAGDHRLGAQRIDAGIDAGLLAMDIYRFDGDRALADLVAA